jgi:CRP-like cAMP-binding protein
MELQDRYPPFQLRGKRFGASEDDDPVVNLLTAEQQSRLQRIATLVQIDRSNKLICAEGARCQFVWLVADGVVRISRCSETGRRQVLAFMMSGDMFGFPEGGIHVNTVRTVGEVTLYKVPWSQLLLVMQKEPDLQARFLTRMAFDLRQAQQRILALGQQSTLQRLASCLLDFISRPELFDQQTRMLTLRITRFDLADYLGSSAENIIRLLSGLERSNLIRRHGIHFLEIRDLPSLREIASGNFRRRNAGI